MVDENLICYNLWGSMIEASGWTAGNPIPGSRDAPNNEKLKEWLIDGMSNVFLRELCLTSKGLWLSSSGYKFLYEGIKTMMREQWPDSDPACMMMGVPHWSESEVLNTLEPVWSREEGVKFEFFSYMPSVAPSDGGCFD